MKDIVRCIICGAVSALAALAVSCSDNVTEEGIYDVNYVYFHAPQTASGSIKYKPANNDEGYEIYEGEVELCLPRVRCTKPASQDIRITLGFNEEMLTQYNAGPGNAENPYNSLPRARFEPAEIVIPAGAYESADSVRIHLEPGDFFDEEKRRYALPVNISTVSSGKVAPHDNGFVYTFQTLHSLISVETNDKGATKNYIYPKNSELHDEEVDLGNIIRISENMGNALEDYNVELAIDENTYSIGYPYNTYTALTENVELLTSNVTIPEGEVCCSSPVKLKIKAEAFKAMTAGKSYVIPLKLTNVTGKGAALTTNGYGVVVSWSYETNAVFVESVSEIGGSPMRENGIAHAYPAYDFNKDKYNIFQDKGAQLRGEVSPNSYTSWNYVYYIELTETCELEGFEIQFQSYYYFTKFELYVGTDGSLTGDEYFWEEGETVTALRGQSSMYFKFKEPVRASCIKIVPKDVNYDCVISSLKFYKKTN